MSRPTLSMIKNLKIRSKMMVVILPLVIVPIFILGAAIGYVATDQAYKGLEENSKADLDHMASFTLDILDGHHHQFEVYREDKRQVVRQEMKTLVDLAYTLITEQLRLLATNKTDLISAQQAVRNSFKNVSIGRSGYLYAITADGVLTVHPAREGENILNIQDDRGRYFIREMVERALKSRPSEVLYTVYPWSNELPGTTEPRRKIVAFRYCPKWNWIVAAGGYLDETYEDPAFESKAMRTLHNKIKDKKVGKTGYIYCMDGNGTLMIHPDAEGQDISSATDSDGRKFVAEMLTNKNGWIRYPWLNSGESRARMKIVRYRYFEPWDWIVAVGSYEDEFYQAANTLKWRIAAYVLLLPLIIGVVAVGLVALASKVLTKPIDGMMGVIRQVRKGRLDQQIPVQSHDELGELAVAFNRMIRMMKKNKELEAALAQQGKMASLGVLSSGVAHEINNPLGVILGYAAYLEKKVPEDDPMHTFIHDIKRESKRCKKIVQDLLSYSRTPKPVLEPVNINRLLKQIVDFSRNHIDLHQVTIHQEYSPAIPTISADADQLRQVAINLLLNAGAATTDGGEIMVKTLIEQDNFVRIDITDQGSGISEENLEKIFEPFFTTKSRGTGLGLAITKQIIDMHQGEIFIDSEQEVGTTVSIRLPIVRDVY